MTSPTPIDSLVWSYHQLGWSTRRIAAEVQTSQASVFRILERLRKDPPPADTVIMNHTPPGGIAGLHPLPPAWDGTEDAPAPPPRWPRGNLVLLIVNLILTVALGATLAAASGGIVARGRTGPAGPAGPAGAPAPQRQFEVCVRYSAYSGAVVSLTAPDGRGSCGTATLIRIPG